MLEVQLGLHGFQWNGEKMISIHLLFKNGFERIGFGIAANDSDAILLHVSWDEEGEALNVIPVGMSVEKDETDRIGSELPEELMAEWADS